MVLYVHLTVWYSIVCPSHGMVGYGMVWYVHLMVWYGMVWYVHLMNTTARPLPLDFTPLLIFSQQRKQINTIFSACVHPTNFNDTTNYSRYKIEKWKLAITPKCRNTHRIISVLFFTLKQSLYFFQQGKPFSLEAFAARYVGMLTAWWIQPGQHSTLNFGLIALNISFELCIIE